MSGPVHSQFTDARKVVFKLHSFLLKQANINANTKIISLKYWQISLIRLFQFKKLNYNIK